MDTGGQNNNHTHCKLSREYLDNIGIETFMRQLIYTAVNRSIDKFYDSQRRRWRIRQNFMELLRPAACADDTV